MNASNLFTILLVVAVFSPARAAEPWKRHTIDASSRGADGVRLADVNGDRRLDIVTPWEEGGSIRIYLQPSRKDVRKRWPKVEVGQVRSPEDALLVDLDGDGNLDVVSCCEGRNRTVYVHWSPKRRELLDSTKWTTVPIPCTRRKQSWMFAVNVGNAKTPRLVLGAKGRAAAVGVLTINRKEPRRVQQWTYRKIQKAGWIMSLLAEDIDATSPRHNVTKTQRHQDTKHSSCLGAFV